jgi:hypothetical protein
MALRVATVIAIPLALIVCFTLVGGFLIYRSKTNDRIHANKDAIVSVRKLTEDLLDERRAREKAIAEAVFRTCVDNEAQDAVLVDILDKTIRSLQRGPRTVARDAYIQNLRDAIRAREPVNEPECKIPAGGG